MLKVCIDVSTFDVFKKFFECVNSEISLTWVTSQQDVCYRWRLCWWRCRDTCRRRRSGCDLSGVSAGWLAQRVWWDDRLRAWTAMASSRSLYRAIELNWTELSSVASMECSKRRNWTELKCQFSCVARTAKSKLLTGSSGVGKLGRSKVGPGKLGFRKVGRSGSKLGQGTRSQSAWVKVDILIMFQQLSAMFSWVIVVLTCPCGRKPKWLIDWMSMSIIVNQIFI